MDQTLHVYEIPKQHFQNNNLDILFYVNQGRDFNFY